MKIENPTVTSVQQDRSHPTTVECTQHQHLRKDQSQMQYAALYLLQPCKM